MPAPHHLILSLSITNGVHFPSLHLDFRDCLNILLGGRGTGKSGVLHLIRFALGAAIPDCYAEEHDDYVRGTLGNGTAVVAVQNQYGARYTSSRTCGSPPVVRDENGEVVSVSLDGDLFKLEAYAQNEIEGIARDPKAQLDLIDKFADAEIGALEESLAEVKRKLEHTGALLLRLRDEIADDSARAEELPSVAEALKGIELGASHAGAPDHDRARAHEAKLQRGREHAAMAALSGELAGTRTALDAFAHDALRKLSRAVEGDLERGPHADVFRHVHAAMQKMAGAIEGAAGRLRTERAVLRGGSEIALSVADDGVGIPADRTASLFIPFGSRKPGGTGVGLLIVRRMVEEVHGGALEIASALGQGTTVTMVLPARQRI